jgi:hypothetical protein
MSDWGGLSLGGVGRMQGAAAMPVGNTGPGGATGMGLMAFLRKLAMERGGGEAPEPQQYDPEAERAAAEAFGLIQPSDVAAMGQPMQPMGQANITPSDLAAAGMEMQPLVSPEEEAIMKRLQGLSLGR